MDFTVEVTDLVHAGYTGQCLDTAFEQWQNGPQGLVLAKQVDGDNRRIRRGQDIHDRQLIEVQRQVLGLIDRLPEIIDNGIQFPRTGIFICLNNNIGEVLA